VKRRRGSRVVMAGLDDRYGSAMSSRVGERALVLRDLHYLGGHPDAPRELDRIDTFFDDHGVSFMRRGERLGSIRWDQVVDLSVDAEYTTTRVSVPVVWLLGVFAALFPRRERRVLLRVADPRGAWMFAVEGISLSELRGGVATIRRRYRP
jgi:hypothetical protein